MTLAPEIAALLPAINAQPPMHQRPLAQLRQPRERIGGAGPVQPVGAVEDRHIDAGDRTIRVRLYAPPPGTHDAPGAPQALPLVVLFHGGGFVFGTIEGNYDHVCRVLCARAGVRVMSVAYRLSPEHKFPAAPDDAWAALQWAVARAGALGVDPARVFVAGGSAGGNLAAVTALRARDLGGPALRGQVLFYPVADHPEPATGSMREFAEGYYLTAADMRWFWAQYLAREADRTHPYAAPLRAERLDGLPPALVLTAGYDPLRDEAERYAQRLQAAGVAVTMRRYEGMVHGFLAFPTPAADQALQQAADWIGRACR
ncbi:alpha/beta hydrolase [Ramlibacter sp. MAHUQ-53]|uniref:alpha/beta hydrolase n=1 Tax=unclassified Ramlibacter TaxID=2617605 RepID=UPI0036323D70